MGERTSAEIAFAEADAQGLPRQIEDPLVYRDLAVLLRPSIADAHTSKTTGARAA